MEQEEEYSPSMLNSMLCSIITELLEQKPNSIPKLARRLLPVIANDKMTEEKKHEIIQRIYYETYVQTPL
jgi:hypothetical protein